jgi:hypothetical protein
LEGVLAQGARLLGVAQLEQGAEKRGGRREGGDVVGAERAAAAVQRVLAQGAGLLGLAQLEQGEGHGDRRP